MKYCCFILLTFFSCANVFSCLVVTSKEKELEHFEEKIALFWNATNQSEDLIRQISWNKEEKHLGFIVPTPTIPEVYDVADKNLFDHIEQIVRRDEIKVLKFKYSLLSYMISSSNSLKENLFSKGVSNDAIQLVSEKELLYFKVIVLKAKTLKDIKQWFKENNFSYDENYDSWLENYIRKGFYFSAFQFRSDKNMDENESSVVGIRFSAKKPFHPWSEPQIKKFQNRKFRLYIFSDSMFDTDAKWSGEMTYSNELIYSNYDFLDLNLDKKYYKWLSVFESRDPGYRGKDDLHFIKKENKVVKKLSSIFDIHEFFYFPLDVIIGSLVAAVLFLKRRSYVMSFLLGISVFVFFNFISLMQ